MKNMKAFFFRTVLVLLVLSLVLLVSPASMFAASGDYPTKPVRLIIPFSPGGATDIAARIFTPGLSERLGQQVVEENHPGAGGLLGTQLASKADPDGYTLCTIGTSLTFKPTLYTNLQFDVVKDFAGIANLAYGTLILAVHPSVPANTLKEFIALAKQKPGELINACSGVGSFSHLAVERLMAAADVKFKVLQFKGGGPALVDLLGGHSDFQMTSITALLPHIQSGKLRALGVATSERSNLLPEVPTFAETIPGLTAQDWWGLMAPAGTPEPIIERLSKEIKALLETDEVKKRLLRLGARPGYKNPAECDQFIESEIKAWAEIIKKANITLQK